MAQQVYEQSENVRGTVFSPMTPVDKW